MQVTITWSAPPVGLTVTHFKIYKSHREVGVYLLLDTIPNTGAPYTYTDPHADCSSWYRVAYYDSNTNTTYHWSNALPGTTNRMNRMAHAIRRGLQDFRITIQYIKDEEIGISNGNQASGQIFYTAYLPILLNSESLKAGRWPYPRCDDPTAIPANARQCDFNDEDGAFTIPSPALYPPSGTRLYACYAYGDTNYPIYTDMELKLWLKSAVETYERWYNEGFYVSGYSEDLEVYDEAGAAPDPERLDIFVHIALALIAMDKAVEGTIAGGAVVREGDITVDLSAGVRSISRFAVDRMNQLKNEVDRMKLEDQVGIRVDIYDRDEWSG